MLVNKRTKHRRRITLSENPRFYPHSVPADLDDKASAEWKPLSFQDKIQEIANCPHLSVYVIMDGRARFWLECEGNGYCLLNVWGCGVKSDKSLALRGTDGIVKKGPKVYETFEHFCEDWKLEKNRNFYLNLLRREVERQVGGGQCPPPCPCICPPKPGSTSSYPSILRDSGYADSPERQSDLTLGQHSNGDSITAPAPTALLVAAPRGNDDAGQSSHHRPDRQVANTSAKTRSLVPQTTNIDSENVTRLGPDQNSSVPPVRRSNGSSSASPASAATAPPVAASHRPDQQVTVATAQSLTPQPGSYHPTAANATARTRSPATGLGPDETSSKPHQQLNEMPMRRSNGSSSASPAPTAPSVVAPRSKGGAAQSSDHNPAPTALLAAPRLISTTSTPNGGLNGVASATTPPASATPPSSAPEPFPSAKDKWYVWAYKAVKSRVGGT
ncbi:hypothetical protein HYDPIDRAFT_115560 [Hydnomerulius pinastri MD-312]|uniref:Uncharacterized protein n=1 Tax=Hydnomerulius pinastri MD-312 TaxID=994086 RepID=A0A0C9W565_9AGAM|nr:hypothetical protein HYDPIDRAFT_115560 [Hydnomerulius pinastri MD-312]